jgi:hypothetical protein
VVYKRSCEKPYRQLMATALLFYFIVSLGVMATTLEACDGAGGLESWNIAPPRWECRAP